MRFAIVVLMVLAFLHLSALPTAASSSEEDRESLRGLPGVRVIIEDLSPAIKADGLSQDSIRSAVELILRSSGIRINQKQLQLPFLYVRLLTVKNRANLYSIAIQVNLNQWVSRPEWSGNAATWEKIMVGQAGAEYIREVIPDIEQMIKDFANDFLAVNPK